MKTSRIVKPLKILSLIVFITPSIVFASWWNPLTWFQKPVPVVQQAPVQPVITKAVSQKLASQKTITTKAVKKETTTASTVDTSVSQ